METGNRFSQCLLDRKDEESRRAKRLRRRTVLIAILIQALALGLLMLRPLFGASADRLMIARLVPLPPWKGTPARQETERHPPATVRHLFVTNFPVHSDFWPAAIRHDVDVNLNCDDAPDIGPDIDTPGISGFGDPNGLLSSMGSSGDRRPFLPVPPREVETPPRKPKLVLVPPEIQEARLVTRVDPVYPVLAKQIRLEGTVVIRAIIAKDGDVESAQILSGHPWLANAAMEAILRWRYRPTLLRGEPIEVETLITVIFRMH